MSAIQEHNIIIILQHFILNLVPNSGVLHIPLLHNNDKQMGHHCKGASL